MGYYETIVGESARDRRLDRFIAEELGLLSRSQIKARALKAQVNGKPVKISRLLLPGDRLELSWESSGSTNLEAEDLELTLIYEDERVVVIDKAQGMVTHPGAGNQTGTVANALAYRRLSRGLNSVDFRTDQAPSHRPGIVHRLDKDTSGVLIAAYDDEALACLAAQFKDRRVKKTYMALVKGCPPLDRGLIDLAIARDPLSRQKFKVVEQGGKTALTSYRVLRRWPAYSLLALQPKTGRTHQLRVHLRQLGCPILGDPIYGRKDDCFPDASLALHAYRLEITLPKADQPSTFTSPLPERFKRLFWALDQLH